MRAYVQSLSDPQESSLIFARQVCDVSNLAFAPQQGFCTVKGRAIPAYSASAAPTKAEQEARAERPYVARAIDLRSCSHPGSVGEGSPWSKRSTARRLAGAIVSR